MEDTNLALGILCSVGTFFVPTRILVRWIMRCGDMIDAGCVDTIACPYYLTET